jgi:hypothetical protein
MVCCTRLKHTLKPIGFLPSPNQSRIVSLTDELKRLRLHIAPHAAVIAVWHEVGNFIAQRCGVVGVVGVHRFSCSRLGQGTAD